MGNDLNLITKKVKLVFGKVLETNIVDFWG